MASLMHQINRSLKEALMSSSVRYQCSGRSCWLIPPATRDKWQEESLAQQKAPESHTVELTVGRVPGPEEGAVESHSSGGAHSKPGGDVSLFKW